MDQRARERETGGLEPAVNRSGPQEDRRCATCGVKLSMYNDGPHCWQHRIGWPWNGPAAKPRYR